MFVVVFENVYIVMEKDGEIDDDLAKLYRK